MRVLVIETASAACSVALIDDGRVVSAIHEVVGRGHAERLVPMISELAGGGRADAILVDCGPGSFTGVRVGLAAARALAFGWGVPVHGFGAPALLAAAAFAERPDLTALTVAITGGHGELFVQRFAGLTLTETTSLASLIPSAAAESAGDDWVIGSGAPALLAARGDEHGADRLPDASDAHHLAPAFTTLPATPVYGRAPDAKLPA
ncbi:tRNA (adenosine(37)-N6)-threonylcarbamoyltransferase complex dimerization subunit type 1 TsaB [Sphingomonas prati]|uniref:tRNA (adenosine(37)-N6)-threonylcarbamoyltransferase complex dimerization subunit type 1 TsaB n=1 Tax=Sphingomonas prati TaxID=1843237 RepID=UPI0012F68E43|nr:tRNA (adenosine(37)-N6)-threonylcarbamoyltransferase complex dimerization subunit type 1 TsaB [Sphingomonas prati]GGE75518.1 tRNA (adenosine(37)-N6)-threonylcarbamoyltransferase complex dimerization subunit type 1 TsaB [Sphingomonas prati]